jgi:thiol-disulfide isomerase/thioredoxin
MARIFMLNLIIVLSLISCTSENSKKDTPKKGEISIVDFTKVEPLLNMSNDTTYVINFWATWCAPCVRELPYFEAINREFSNSKVKVILINLDFSNHYDSRLIPFVKEKNIQSLVIMLDDPDANKWINKVDPSWTGAIPATLIYNKNKREFFEKEFTSQELNEIVKSFITN